MYFSTHIQIDQTTDDLSGFHILGLPAGLWIRIRIGSGFRDFVDPDPVIFKKKYNYFMKKILMNNTSIFDLI
jgi:hypothetical protein